jgi:integrase
VLSDTKSGHGRATALDAETAAWWRSEHQRAEQRHLDSFRQPLAVDAFTFSRDPQGTVPRRPDTITKGWRSLCAVAGDTMGVELRDLRRWHATVLDNDFDYSTDAIGRRLGHSHARIRTEMTQRYITTSEQRDRQMAADIGRRVAEVELLAAETLDDNSVGDSNRTRE